MYPRIENKKQLVEAIEKLSDLREQIDSLQSEELSVVNSIAFAKSVYDDVDRMDNGDYRFRCGRHVVQIRKETKYSRSDVSLYTLGTEYDMAEKAAQEAATVGMAPPSN